jgi:hypothetical protein
MPALKDCQAVSLLVIFYTYTYNSNTYHIFTEFFRMKNTPHARNLFAMRKHYILCFTIPKQFSLFPQVIHRFERLKLKIQRLTIAKDHSMQTSPPIRTNWNDIGRKLRIAHRVPNHRHINTVNSARKPAQYADKTSGGCNKRLPELSLSRISSTNRELLPSRYTPGFSKRPIC